MCLSLFIVAVVRLLLSQAALVDVLQRVGSLHRQLRHADARQRVLLWKHPRLQVWVVLPLPVRILQRCLVDLPHGLWGQRHSETQRQVLDPDGLMVFTFGATNWDTLFTTHFGREPADREDEMLLWGPGGKLGLRVVFWLFSGCFVFWLFSGCLLVVFWLFLAGIFSSCHRLAVWRLTTEDEGVCAAFKDYCKGQC